MPIKFLIIQSDADVYNINATAMAVHGVSVSSIEADKLASILADQPEVILLSSQSAPNLTHRLRQISGIWPDCKIIIRTECSTSLVLASLQLGVTGVLNLWHAPEQLAEIIRQVLNGEYYLDNDIAQLLAVRHIKKMLEPFAALSSREFDVFCMLSEGYSLQAVGEQLGISQKTVSNCQALLKLKLAVENRQEMMAFAKSHGLISNKKV
jgi:two-component system invasion response regulator UvrY